MSVENPRPQTFRVTNGTVIPTTESRILSSATITESIESHGAFNFFDIKNRSTEDVFIRLDGDANRAFFLGQGTGIVTDAEDRLFYSLVEIVNDSATEIAIDEIEATFIRRRL